MPRRIEAALRRQLRQARGRLGLREAQPRPHFLGVGTQKGGTTTLYRLLRQHPEVFIPKEKEVHYWDMHFKKDDLWYESQFPDDVEGKVVGEVTPDYLSMWMEKVRE